MRLRNAARILIALFGIILWSQNASPSPSPQSTVSRPPNQKSQSTQQHTNTEQRGSEETPFVIKILPNQAQNEFQTDTSGRPENPTNSWSLGDRIAVIASIVAFMQFGALVITVLVMIRSNHRQLRAYVVMELGNIGNVANPIPLYEGQDMKPTGAEITNSACGPIAYLQVKNSGQTPAYRVVHWGNIIFREYPLKSPLEYPPSLGDKHASVLGPNIVSSKLLFLPKPLTEQEVSNLRTGQGAIYVYGEIQYRDAFNKRRLTRYSSMHHVGQGAIGVNTGLTFTDEGNHAN